MKITKLILPAAVLALVVAGCGGGAAAHVHHAAAKPVAAVPIPTALVTCATVSPSLNRLVTDLRTPAGAAAYDGGPYAGSRDTDLQNFLTSASKVARSEPSRPPGISADIVQAVFTGSSLAADGAEPASKAATDMASFRAVMADLGRDCFLLTAHQAGRVAHPPAPRPKPKPKPRHHSSPTITYVVTGSPAMVTYGPAGSDFSGSVPMDITAPLGSPVYYAIDAQLQGGGQVSCTIEVNGQAISSASATGGYNIAMCEIVQDPLSGQWSDANTGG